MIARQQQTTDNRQQTTNSCMHSITKPQQPEAEAEEFSGEEEEERLFMCSFYTGQLPSLPPSGGHIARRYPFIIQTVKFTVRSLPGRSFAIESSV